MHEAGASCSAIVPYREHPGVKSRLAIELTPAQRLTLARALLGRVLTVLLASRSIGQVLLVGDAPPPAFWASEPRLRYLASALPLNEAAALGCRAAAEQGAGEVLIAHADLATLSAARVEELIARGRSLSGPKRAVLASCQRQDGTNLLWLSPIEAVAFRYGAGSRKRHLEMLVQAGYSVVEAPAVPDIDSYADLERLAPELLPRL